MHARVLFTLNAILLVMLAISAPFIEPGSDTFVVAVASLGVILLSMTGLGLVIWRNRKLAEEATEAPMEEALR